MRLGGSGQRKKKFFLCPLPPNAVYLHLGREKFGPVVSPSTRHTSLVRFEKRMNFIVTKYNTVDVHVCARVCVGVRVCVRAYEQLTMTRSHWLRSP